MSRLLCRSSFSSFEFEDVDVNDRYQYIRDVGKGSYGEVWLVTPRHPSSSSKNSNKQHVLKRLDLNQKANDATSNDIDVAEREAKLLSTLKHPNIVAYIESFRSNDGFLNIVMAYCEGGDLYTKLKGIKAKKEYLPEDQITEWFIQICMALQYIHEKGILHRDLKTQNIFLTKLGMVKVGDLGIARVLESGTDMATTIIGTPYYMSPEIFSNEPYNQKSDIWALGCCVYEMTTLEHAFNAKDMSSLVIKIICGQMPQLPKKYNEELTEIIKLMLSKNPYDRPTAKSILHRPYIKQSIIKTLNKIMKKPANDFDSIRENGSSFDALSVRSSNEEESSPPARHRSSQSRSRNNQGLPSHPPLPPPISWSPSLPKSDKSIQSNNIAAPSEARLRRRNRILQRDSSPTINDDEPIESKLAIKVLHRDTLSRHKHEQIQNHIRKRSQTSFDDDVDHVIPLQSRTPSAKLAAPLPLSSSPKQYKMPNSATSSIESDQSKHSADDESVNHSSERELYIHRPSSQASTTSSSRQRRRENRIRQSGASASVELQPKISHSSLHDSFSTEVERKVEGEKDMNEFVFALTITLKRSPVQVDSNELTSSSVDTETTIVEENLPDNGRRPPRIQRQIKILREECLKDISAEKLQRIVRLGSKLGYQQGVDEVIKEIGKELYGKYKRQIFLLQAYEGSWDQP